MVDEGNGIRRPAASQVHHRTLFQWIIDNLSWLPQYATVYVYVDNRKLSGTDPPAYWPHFAPWIKGRCTVTGPYRENFFFSVQRLRGFRQVVTQAFTCRKLN